MTIRATVNKTGGNNTLCDQFWGDIHWVHTVRFHSISCWDLSGWGYWLKCCHCLGQLLHFVLCFHQKVMPWWRLRRWLLRLLLCTLQVLTNFVVIFNLRKKHSIKTFLPFIKYRIVASTNTCYYSKKINFLSKGDSI